MNDFKGSVAEQNITISTDIVRTAVVGGNFYQSMLYLFNRFTDFGADTPVYPVVTRQTYKDVIDAYAYMSDEDKGLIKNNLEGLYYHNADITVYIIPYDEYENKKMLGYFTYLDLLWRSLQSDEQRAYRILNEGVTPPPSEYLAVLNSKYDKNFTQFITDLPVDPSLVKGIDYEKSIGSARSLDQNYLKAPVALFARPSMPSGSQSDNNVFIDASGKPIGYSPALYQLGWMLSFSNESGTPVGNQSDMKALDFQIVLPTDGDGSDPIEGCSAVFADAFKNNNINFFKPVGDGTANVNNFGGKMYCYTDPKVRAIVAEWIVAYENFINRVACAKIITSGKALKNVRTYNALLDSVKANLVSMVNTGVITNFEMNPPSFDNLPITDGQTISIPNAWEADFVQTVHNVRISGTLTVTQ